LKKFEFSDNQIKSYGQLLEEKFDLRIDYLNPISRDIQEEVIQNILKNNSMLSYYSIKMGCIWGEIYDEETKKCIFCPEFSYSMGNDQRFCQVCPDHFKCGGNSHHIILEAGYWRPNISSIDVLECIKNQNVCLEDGKCFEGNSGVMCEECDSEKNYARENNFASCQKCDYLGWQVIKMLIYFTFNLLII
jgi:hypothetical protein